MILMYITQPGFVNVNIFIFLFLRCLYFLIFLLTRDCYCQVSQVNFETFDISSVLLTFASVC